MGEGSNNHFKLPVPSMNNSKGRVLQDLVRRSIWRFRVGSALQVDGPDCGRGGGGGGYRGPLDAHWSGENVTGGGPDTEPSLRPTCPAALPADPPPLIPGDGDVGYWELPVSRLSISVYRCGMLDGQILAFNWCQNKPKTTASKILLYNTLS